MTPRSTLMAHQLEKGTEELRRTRARSRKLFWAVGLFSTFMNLLMLTGPLFMLQVYDRVLGSRSVETLTALFALVAFLYLVMGCLDFVRGRVLSRIAARFQESLDHRVFNAALRGATTPSLRPLTQTAVQDLEAIQRFLASPLIGAFFDLPWTPIFLLAIFIFHPWLGSLALIGGAVLIVIALFNQASTRRANVEAARMGRSADRLSEQMRSESELVRSLGMVGAAYRRWKHQRTEALQHSIGASDASGRFTAVSKALRLFLQSAMLALGAYLVLQGELTPGAMIAGSILLGRALAPIEQAIGQWALWQRAHLGWHNLVALLSSVPPQQQVTPLPRPKAHLKVSNMTVIPPGESTAALKMANFELNPGQAMGVIGPSGSGKSTLARTITGVWAPAGGFVRLDGATLDQYDPDVLGTYIGYLPQRVELFDGTITDNIALLSAKPDPQAVVRAAQLADAHKMILELPKGYDTPVTTAGGRLSGGQMQRIGLARALYHDPVLLVLDEPNSNLDNEGSKALNSAIRQMKASDKSVLIMAHRPAAIQECDLLLVLDQGNQRAFGPREEVLKKTVSNYQTIQNTPTAGGVT